MTDFQSWLRPAMHVHLVKEAIIGDPYKKQQVINQKKPSNISAPTLSGFLSC